MEGAIFGDHMGLQGAPLGFIIPLKWIDREGIWGSCYKKHPKPYSICFRRTAGFRVQGFWSEMPQPGGIGKAPFMARLGEDLLICPYFLVVCCKCGKENAKTLIMYNIINVSGLAE